MKYEQVITLVLHFYIEKDCQQDKDCHCRDDDLWNGKRRSASDLTCLSIYHELINLVFVFEVGYPDGQQQVFVCNVAIICCYHNIPYNISGIFLPDLIRYMTG